MIKLTDALKSLRPGAEWVHYGGGYENLEWLDKVQTKPTQEEVQVEIERLQAEYEYNEYQRKRAKEYPDFKEYLDGIVKGDEAQVQAYIEACKAVKEKYPKPE